MSIPGCYVYVYVNVNDCFREGREVGCVVKIILEHKKSNIALLSCCCLEEIGDNLRLPHQVTPV